MSSKDCPIVAVAPTPHVKGVSTLTSMEDSPSLETLPLGEAIQREWETDAHLVSYCLPGLEPGDPFARCNKPLLSELRREGHELHRTVLALDWDTPGHEPWGESFSQVEFQDLLIQAIEKFDLLGLYSVIYFTRHGARLIYILDEPMNVQESESALRWFVKRASQAGLKCDMLVDWTRLFRLPRVMRDGVPTSQEPYFDIDMDLSQRLPVSELGRAAAFEKREEEEYVGEIRDIDDPMPDPDEARELVEYRSKTSGRFTLTQWGKAAKKALKGRECFGAAFEHQQMAAPGSRDNTIHQYAGQVVAMTYNIRGTTPEHVFGLLCEPVSSLEPEEGTDWLQVLWSAVQRLWAKEEAKAKWQEEEERQEEEQKLSVAGQVLQGMREWCSAEPLSWEDEDAFAWAKEHLIASAGTCYYLIGRDGYYRNQEYQKQHVPAAIRQHLPELIETKEWSGDKLKDVPVTSILSDHLTVVKEVEALPGLPNPYIEDIDEPNAVLKVPAYRRNPHLIPEFDDEVDEWLGEMFGGNKDEAMKWIAFALAFEEGTTCALSIKGGQGTGKKMLLQGLAECLESPCTATDTDLTSQYQYGILKSPFLVVNEGWSSSTIGGKHPADRFREVTSGDPIIANRRYRDPISVRNPMRVIFTANNLDVIRKLADKDDLTKDDREALAIRLLHFDVGSGAKDWLRDRGGMDFTGRPGRRWIYTDHGEPGDFIVAKHFLWLYENRHKYWTAGKRFLVEGLGSQDLMFEMETQVGVAPLVIEVLLSMFSRHRTIDEIAVSEDGRVYVVPSGVLNHWRNHFIDKTRGQALTINNITHSLTGLCKPQEQREMFAVPGAESKGERNWREVDLVKVIRAGENNGIRCTQLRKALETQGASDVRST